MNDRQKELLQLLLTHEGGALQIKDLSEQLRCSEKTVRNDLDRIEEEVERYERASLIRKPGYGIEIEADEETRTAIFSTLSSVEKQTVEERLLEITFQLLTSSKAVTLQHFAEQYFVPRTMIKKDMEAIADWLARFDLQLISKTRLGQAVEGSELNKRNALAHLPELLPSVQREKNYVLDLFMPYEISTVRKALRDMQDQFPIRFTEEASENLLVHALIMIKRIRQKAPVFVEAAEKAKAARQKEYHYSAYFFEQMKAAFQLSFPEEEQVYFTWHLISSKRTEENAGQQIDYTMQEVALVTGLIGRMERLTLFPFESDSILLDGLTIHMHSVLNRIRYGFPITNPLLTDIKKMYPYTFNMTILALEELKPVYPYNIPEDEVAYIVLHFQASIERIEGKREKVKNALIVCHMGVGMSHLLEAKIKQLYPEIEIIGCIGKAELPDMLKQKAVNFVISTVPLERTQVDHVLISPLFGKEDKQTLNRFLAELEQTANGHAVSETSPFLKEELILFPLENLHRFELVEKMANHLFEKGYTDKAFIHSTLQRERKSATAIGGGIAIPHGSPDLVKTSAISIAVLKEPIEWGSERVSLVIMLAISEADRHNLRDIMGGIATLSESPVSVNQLSQTRTPEEFLQVLQSNT